VTTFCSEAAAAMPARYRDARAGLRLGVVDTTVDHVPANAASYEIGDDLALVPTWGMFAVTDALMGHWGVSIDELVATASGNVTALPAERSTHHSGEATVEAVIGHHWVSSLIVDIARSSRGEDGFLVAVPRSDVMAVTPVVGVETLDGLDALIAISEGLYDPDDLGISPHVWWWFQGAYRRVTDHTEGGSLDFLHHTNLSAFYLARAIEHLAGPCIECGRE
jgi:hypothetical protein